MWFWFAAELQWGKLSSSGTSWSDSPKSDPRVGWGGDVELNWIEGALFLEMIPPLSEWPTSRMMFMQVVHKFGANLRKVSETLLLSHFFVLTNLSCWWDFDANLRKVSDTLLLPLSSSASAFSLSREVSSNSISSSSEVSSNAISSSSLSSSSRIPLNPWITMFLYAVHLFPMFSYAGSLPSSVWKHFPGKHRATNIFMYHDGGAKYHRFSGEKARKYDYIKLRMKMEKFQLF